MGMYRGGLSTLLVRLQIQNSRLGRAMRGFCVLLISFFNREKKITFLLFEKEIKKFSSFFTIRKIFQTKQQNNG